MNDQPSQKVFDSLLAELLSKQTPPDLSDRIVAAWKAEKLTGSQAEVAEQKAVTRPLIKAEVVAGPNTKPAVRSSGTTRVSRRPSPSAKPVSSAAWQALLAVSAGAGAILGGWQLIVHLNAPPPLAKNSANVAPPSLPPTGPGEFAPSAELELASNNPARLEPGSGEQRTVGPHESLNLDNLPFESGRPAEATEVIASAPRRDVAPLSDSEIVSKIDALLAELWEQTDVQPTSPLPADALVQRASERLTGQTLKLVSLDNPESARGRLQSMIGSKRFASNMADRWVDLWLARSAVDTSSEQIASLKQTVATKIESKRNFHELIVDLLGGDLESSGPAETFVGALAGGSNHLLVQRLGSHFLDANLACVRCHASATPARSAAAEQLAQQSTYWSMVAMLKGVDAQGNARLGERKLTDQQARIFAPGENPLAYYDLPDGRMKAAQAVLPNGADWRSTQQPTPRRALAEWIADSSELDAATSNRMWQFLVGSALVPQVATANTAGMPVKQAVLDLLSEQYRASGHSLQRLASWITASMAFDRRPLELSQEGLLLASDAKLQRVKLAQAVFAIAPPNDEQLPLDKNIALAIKLRDTSDAQITLAQPAAQGSAKQVPRQPASTPQPPLAFQLQADHITPEQQRFVDALMQASGLSWDERVQHVVLLNPQYRPDGRIQQLAKSLLQQHNGDAQAALHDLLWAVEAAL